MTITDVQTQVDETAQAIVLLDPCDVPGLTDLGHQLGELAEGLRETGHETEAVAGRAIMSNGNVALILDPAGLTRVAHSSDTTISVEEEAPEPEPET